MVGAVSQFKIGLIAMLAISTTAYAGTKATKSRVWAGPSKTQVVLELNRAPDYKVFTLNNPHRVVIDLKNTKKVWARNPLAPKKSFLRNIRVGTNGKKKQHLRVVLDAKDGITARTFALKPNKLYGHRLMIELTKGARGAVKSSGKPKKRARDIIVAIDAGHGGEDPGAVGPSGALEKDVVMKISRKLFALIKREPGMKPVMIRKGDYYVGLRERMELARKHQADIFVSVHANSFRDRRVNGSAVYILSRKGATDEATRWLVQRENNSDLVGGVQLRKHDSVLKSVIFDLVQKRSMESSVYAAEDVLSSIGRVNRLHKGRLQHAAFQVLMSPDIPSLLIETAFISNPREERLLKSSAYQSRLASSILRGVKKHFMAHPPAGTLFAQWRGKPNRHVVARGDTLNGIARRYGVSVKSIQGANRGVGSVLEIGQRLSIPSKK